MNNINLQHAILYYRLELAIIRNGPKIGSLQFQRNHSSYILCSIPDDFHAPFAFLASKVATVSEIGRNNIRSNVQNKKNDRISSRFGIRMAEQTEKISKRATFNN